MPYTALSRIASGPAGRNSSIGGHNLLTQGRVREVTIDLLNSNSYWFELFDTFAPMSWLISESLT